MTLTPFDYWSWWRTAVKDLKIQPDQAWKMDFIEINKLINQDKKFNDVSIMLNYEREQNGASKEWLQKG